jgi:hypothetical protein
MHTDPTSLQNRRPNDRRSRTRGKGKNGGNKQRPVSGAVGTPGDNQPPNNDGSHSGGPRSIPATRTHNALAVATTSCCRPRPAQKRRYLISEDSILQIINDIAEDMLRPNTSKKELIQVIRYLGDELEWANRQKVEALTHISVKLTEFGVDALNFGVEALDIAQWTDKP